MEISVINCFYVIQVTANEEVLPLPFAKVGGMMIAGNILVYGDDPGLLTTRRFLLERAGYRVHATTEFADAMLMIMSHQINVLLLCQSAQSDELSGGLKFVILSFAGRDVPVGYAEIVEGLEGPSVLLPTIRGILAFHAVPQSHFVN